MLFSITSTIIGLVALTQAADHAVVVGGPGGIIAFNPPSVVRRYSFHRSLFYFSYMGFVVCRSR